uniref:Integrase zinc-binding domain-containing protein n=1 Tax=Crocodylus porosus TaxID=8502 RepID=A0A7M4ESB5_CROPO
MGPMASVSTPTVSLSDHLVQWLHEFWGHPGGNSAKAQACQWIAATRRCAACQASKPTSTRRYERGAFTSIHFHPGKTWQIDLIGPLLGDPPSLVSY